jgi:saccharopine dehydrogenase (NAD+, L-lysine-forming)
MKSPTRILIAGGTGKAGRKIARYLCWQEVIIELTLAGRKNWVADWSAKSLMEYDTDRDIKYIELDLANVSQMRHVLPDYDLLIVASSTIPLAGQVARACLDSGTDYYDIQISSPTKLAALRALEPDIRKAGLCFITEGGFHPGILAPMVRHLAAQPGRIESANIYAVLRFDWNRMGASAQTLDEFILEFKNYSSRIWHESRWVEPSYWQTKTYAFDVPFGKAYVAPMFFEELEAMPVQIPSLREMGVYMAGFN